MAWALFIGFILLVLARVPITMAIGSAVLLAFLFAESPINLLILPLQVIEGVESPALISVPFFIMAGNLMNAVGMTDRIFGFASALVGHFRAGLAQVNVLASMIFAGISGAAVADIAGLGTIEVKAMREHGYPPDFAAALSVVSSVVGPLIPPSIPLVIYGFISNTSIGRLFLAGVLPGLLVGATLMVYIRMIADSRGFPREPRVPPKKILAVTVDGFAALIAPGIIIGAVVTGFTTTTEAGVLACAYSLLLGVVYRTLDWRRLRKAVTDTTIVTAVIMIIVGYSTVMGWLLAYEQWPQAIAQTALLVIDDKYAFLAILLVFLLVIGLFLEGIPAMLILVPILLPIVDKFGIDRVQFGVVFTFAMLIGIATPPMGIGLFIMVEVAQISLERISLAVLPLLIPLVVALVLVTYVPAFTLWLPNLVMGPP